jgi:transposase
VQRLDARVPHGHWKALTFISALRHDRIDTPWVINGPINGELFATYVEQVLAPTLAPGDIVILDNLGSHKGRRARRTIRAAGACNTSTHRRASRLRLRVGSWERVAVTRLGVGPRR